MSDTFKKDPTDPTVPPLMFPEKNIAEEIIDSQDVNKNVMDLKAKYDAKIIAHERTERKLDDAGKLLEQEREKSAQLRQELLKSVDIEKEVLSIPLILPSKNNKYRVKC